PRSVWEYAQHDPACLVGPEELEAWRSTGINDQHGPNLAIVVQELEANRPPCRGPEHRAHLSGVLHQHNPFGADLINHRSHRYRLRNRLRRTRCRGAETNSREQHQYRRARGELPATMRTLETIESFSEASKCVSLHSRLLTAGTCPACLTSQKEAPVGDDFLSRRSEERRVGKECRTRRWAYENIKKKRTRQDRSQTT